MFISWYLGVAQEYVIFILLCNPSILHTKHVFIYMYVPYVHENK